jgi:hypothetical protein
MKIGAMSIRMRWAEVYGEGESLVQNHSFTLVLTKSLHNIEFVRGAGTKPVRN